MAGSPSGPVPTRASRSYSLPSMPTPTQCTQYLLPNPIVFRIGLHHKLNRFLRGYLNISFHNQSHLNSIALRMRLNHNQVMYFCRNIFHNQHHPNPISSRMCHRRFISEHLNHLKCLTLSQAIHTFVLRLRILLPKWSNRLLLLQMILFKCLMAVT